MQHKHNESSFITQMFLCIAGTTVLMDCCQFLNFGTSKRELEGDPYIAAIYRSLKPRSISDLNSPDGIIFVNSLFLLREELMKLNIATTQMNLKELKHLANQITEAIEHEISNEKNWKGESVVNGYHITNAAPRLASAIYQIRAGTYVSGPQTVMPLNF